MRLDGRGQRTTCADEAVAVGMLFDNGEPAHFFQHRLGTLKPLPCTVCQIVRLVRAGQASSHFVKDGREILLLVREGGHEGVEHLVVGLVTSSERAHALVLITSNLTGRSSPSEGDTNGCPSECEFSIVGGPQVLGL